MTQKLEDQLAAAEEKLAKLRAQARAKQARERRAERKARTHALIILGGQAICFCRAWVKQVESKGHDVDWVIRSFQKMACESEQVKDWEKGIALLTDELKKGDR